MNKGLEDGSGITLRSVDHTLAIVVPAARRGSRARGVVNGATSRVSANAVGTPGVRHEPGQMATLASA
jgi:hypothetical protein